MERERGKVVVYVTTLGIVRDTYERCLRIRKILWTLLVRFEERDVFMARDTQIQLLDRLHARGVTVPHVFLEGQYLGDAEQIERLNECGELRRLLQPYRRAASASTCDTCGGFRLLPCTVCNGSKKSVHRNDWTLEFVALKCSSCDESGLVKCQDCAEYKDVNGNHNG
ncbi:Glutaredoxin domain-containing cysteine-rich protein [Penaeus vannamei]|uniref:Glutaredoxin domain-containing cysteine-rich protein n=2 Tax=Penaeus vannamei TaxID=6689 RepID=A0A423U5Z2_PENVA|nr:Glutaredoxin domain-containing cysteine-rich protein [Penaeus vannamei]